MYIESLTHAHSISQRFALLVRTHTDKRLVTQCDQICLVLFQAGGVL